MSGTVKILGTGYVNPDALRVANGTGSLKIRAYSNGLYDVGPHPYDSRRCKECQDKYSQGWFIQHIDYYVDPSFLEDRKNMMN
jgi:hypothetical protein